MQTPGCVGIDVKSGAGEMLMKNNPLTWITRITALRTQHLKITVATHPCNWHVACHAFGRSELDILKCKEEPLT